MGKAAMTKAIQAASIYEVVIREFSKSAARSYRAAQIIKFEEMFTQNLTGKLSSNAEMNLLVFFSFLDKSFARVQIKLKSKKTSKFGAAVFKNSPVKS